LADKAVSAILSLLTFFLIAEKESKIRFPLLFPQKAVNFLLAVQKKVNNGGGGIQSPKIWELL